MTFHCKIDKYLEDYFKVPLLFRASEVIKMRSTNHITGNKKVAVINFSYVN